MNRILKRKQTEVYPKASDPRAEGTYSCEKLVVFLNDEPVVSALLVLRISAC